MRAADDRLGPFPAPSDTTTTRFLRGLTPIEESLVLRSWRASPTPRTTSRPWLPVLPPRWVLEKSALPSLPPSARLCRFLRLSDAIDIPFRTARHDRVIRREGARFADLLMWISNPRGDT